MKTSGSIPLLGGNAAMKVTVQTRGNSKHIISYITNHYVKRQFKHKFILKTYFCGLPRICAISERGCKPRGKKHCSVYTEFIEVLAPLVAESKFMG